MKTTCCVWCSAFVKVRDTYNDLQHKAVCSTTCREAEMMFTQYWSDEEINRRAHYRKLTQGEDDDST
jgi:hypothetical protein